MHDRIEQAMMADGAAAVIAPAPAGPAIEAFLGTEETRLRDLVAFGMAVQAGRIGPEGIEELRGKAEAELHAHAFRLLHNEVERVRRQAMDEERARATRGSGFGRLVGANLLALCLFAAAGLVLLAIDPGLFSRLAQSLAQLLAKG